MASYALACENFPKDNKM